ncbi:hypothetical protein PBY51_001766 [Eleginops maclovinus]|uniref:Uncharacterized protein n=1 Tax=Eleginops maclovinus TaxID=56733 RepID=A0AAN8A0M7_ELEMC|nr:hypothetical protein PBY51_001766 [Eleginops maclovinus]
MCSAAGEGRAELECSVLEEDWQRGQRYMAQWHSVTLLPQHQQRPSVTEEEHSGKHGEARRLLQRFLSGAISRNYLHPKTQPTRRPHQSTFNPSATGPKVQQANIILYATTGAKSTA